MATAKPRPDNIIGNLLLGQDDLNAPIYRVPRHSPPNFFQTLGADIDPGETSLYVPMQSIGTADRPFYMSIGSEIVLVTNVSGNYVNVVRGQLGTQALNHVANDKLYLYNPPQFRAGGQNDNPDPTPHGSTRPNVTMPLKRRVGPVISQPSGRVPAYPGLTPKGRIYSYWHGQATARPHYPRGGGGSDFVAKVRVTFAAKALLISGGVSEIAVQWLDDTTGEGINMNIGIANDNTLHEADTGLIDIGDTLSIDDTWTFLIGAVDFGTGPYVIVNTIGLEAVYEDMTTHTGTVDPADPSVSYRNGGSYDSALVSAKLPYRVNPFSPFALMITDKPFRDYIT